MSNETQLSDPFIVQALQELNNLSDLHGTVAKKLFEDCNSELFPCDALSFAVLERSLHLIKSFNLLLSNGVYTTGVGLLRMQMDNVLRLNGVCLSDNPHGIANLIAKGIPLRTLKDASGKKMTDARLVEQLSADNPWVNHVYELACSYIHLSDAHIRHLLLRSTGQGDGLREISIGNEEYVEVEHKIELINAFSVITRGILELIRQWCVIRHHQGTNEFLKTKFADPV